MEITITESMLRKRALWNYFFFYSLFLSFPPPLGAQHRKADLHKLIFFTPLELKCSCSTHFRSRQKGGESEGERAFFRGTSGCNLIKTHYIKYIRVRCVQRLHPFDEEEKEEEKSSTLSQARVTFYTVLGVRKKSIPLCLPLSQVFYTGVLYSCFLTPRGS